MDWSKNNLLSNAKHQFDSLANLCFEFDKGDLNYGLDISHKLRVILHHPPASFEPDHQNFLKLPLGIVAIQQQKLPINYLSALFLHAV